MDMPYQEKDFQTAFRAWALHHLPTAACELKISKGDSIYYKDVKNHQERALQQVRNSTFFLKIPDLQNQNPFDCFTMRRQHAFVVIMFKAPSDKFFLIDINNWCKYRAKSDSKRFSIDDAEAIGTEVSFSASKTKQQ